MFLLFQMVYFQVPAVSFPGVLKPPPHSNHVCHPKVRSLAGKLQAFGAPEGEGWKAPWFQGKNESPKQQYFGVPWILVFKRCLNIHIYIYVYPFIQDHSW